MWIPSRVPANQSDASSAWPNLSTRKSSETLDLPLRISIQLKPAQLKASDGLIPLSFWNFNLIMTSSLIDVDWYIFNWSICEFIFFLDLYRHNRNEMIINFERSWFLFRIQTTLPKCKVSVDTRSLHYVKPCSLKFKWHKVTHILEYTRNSSFVMRTKKAIQLPSLSIRISFTHSHDEI